MPISVRNSLQEKGVSALSAVIVLPLLIIIMAVLFDLGRIYLTMIFAKNVALTAAKLATATSPQTEAPADLNLLVKPAPGEPGSITSAREQFWAGQLDPASPSFHGLNYYTEKELKSLNLAYGFMTDLNSDIAFPIMSGLSSASDLQGGISCSIYFKFDDLTDPLDTEKNYSRIYYTDCAVPYLGLNLFTTFIGAEFYTISANAYAYKSGDITP